MDSYRRDDITHRPIVVYATVKHAAHCQRVDCLCLGGISETIHKVVLTLHSISLGFAPDEDLDIAAVVVTVVYGNSLAARRDIVVSGEKVAEHIKVAMTTLVRQPAFELLVRFMQSSVSLLPFFR